MVRDAIVLRSIRDTVRERCLEKGDTLTLEMAINIGQNHEMSQESPKSISGEDPKVRAVHDKRYLKRRQNTIVLGQDMILVSGTNEHHRLKLAQSVATATNIRNVQQEIANAIFAINEDTMKKCVEIN